jgi:uncharacterized protein YkwD
MLWALMLSFALAGKAGGQASAPPARKAVVGSSQSSTQPTPKLLSAALPSSTEDYGAESALLDLANKSRQEAGVPPLRMDESLAEAARTHARLMVDRQQLSHQFDGEPSLMPRLRESGLQLNQAGENVAYNSSAEKAFEALMQSAPHRQNLLDPDFNSVGIAAFWNEGRLYVVQDFAHQLPKFVPSKQPR